MTEGRRRHTRRRRSPHRLARVAAVAAALAVLPFLLLVRGAVWAHTHLGVGPVPALGVAAAAAAAVVGALAWGGARRGSRRRRRLVQAWVGLALVHLIYGLLYVSAGFVEEPVARRVVRDLHPLLRLATAPVVLADPDAVLTAAGRTPEDFERLGLTPREAALHVPADDGWVRALDLDVQDRPVWRMRAVELGLWTLGFHTRRLRGTARHLHVSLRDPG